VIKISKNEAFDMIMLVGDGCPSCSEAKLKLKRHIKSGKITVLDVTKDDLALEIAKKYNVQSVPSVIVRNRVSKTTKVCQLSRDFTKLLCGKKIFDL